MDKKAALSKTNLTIGALSKRTGCKVETIRYYEHIGFLPDPPRTEAGHRRYNENHFRRLIFIRRCREMGFHQSQIKTLLQLVDGGHYTCAEVKEIAVRHLGDIQQKIVDLKKLERILKNMSAQCKRGMVPECPVIDALTYTNS
ncbi:MAG TPA: helix-turn-helix domain-containing protein [Acidiferrobacterales bacterium]|nr:helix-turn-helix domain-containing protein [Acidiferrobacterales bacterium]